MTGRVNMVQFALKPTFSCTASKLLLLLMIFMFYVFNVAAQSTQELKSRANLIVAQDGSGNYKTVTEAVAATPNYTNRFIIYVKKGVYNEHIVIEKTKTNITIVGDGQTATILTGNLNAVDGVSISHSATLGVEGDGFIAQDLTIRNTAGPEKHQAVALRINANRAVIYRCSIEGYQDTLFAQRGKQYYRDSYITGTVDFICGDATAVFQYCEIVARKPQKGGSNVVTAQQRNRLEDNSGFSIHKCKITAIPGLEASVKTYLGRPWGNFSTTVVMDSFLDYVIDPTGWTSWSNNTTRRLSTLFYGEYRNRGPGADTRRRVGWKGFKIITDPKEAVKFTVGQFINEGSWLNGTGIPFEDGL